MPRILITGLSGAGKSTLLAELDRRGVFTVDTDYGGWVNPDGRWNKRKLAELLSSRTDVAVSGAVENQIDGKRPKNSTLLVPWLS